MSDSEQSQKYSANGKQGADNEPEGGSASHAAPTSSPLNEQEIWQFERLIRLVGEEGLARLRRAHVMVVGIGGVGSWATEALARMALGKLTLVDFDCVSPSNLNRQLTALQATMGRPKCQVMAERVRAISLATEVETLVETYNPDTSAAILARRPDVILDAIDNITYKCHLLATARKMGLKIITSTGAAGRLDPTRIKVADLSHTKVDPVALQVRKKLRRDWGYPGNKSFHIPAVFSDEDPLAPLPVPMLSPDLRWTLPTEEPADLPPIAPPAADATPDGLSPADFEPEEERVTRKAPPYGTASFVTGAFGLTAASLAIRLILEDEG